MEKYFNINIEFDKKEVVKVIDKSINNQSKGYVCVVDGNVLATSYKDCEYQNIINNSLVNICDGSSIAILSSLIYNRKLKSFTGSDIFSSFIDKNYKQYFLGNTEENLILLYKKIRDKDFDIQNYHFKTLPFQKVNEFDYEMIAEDINRFSPDIIWVSLGAPKQECFISNLLPYIDNGILFAIGATINFYIGNDKNKRAPKWMRILHLEWFYRLIVEPTKTIKRVSNYLLLLPKMIINEIINKYSKNETTS